jgi:hypothetical protein
MKKTDNRPQRDRFIAAAKAIGADETGAKFEKAMKKIAKVKKSTNEKKTS